MVRVQLSTQYHSPLVYPNHRAVTYRIKVRVQMSMVYYLQTMHLCHRAVTSLLVVRLLVSVANISTVPHDDLYHSVVKAHSQETSNLSTSIPQGLTYHLVVKLLISRLCHTHCTYQFNRHRTQILPISICNTALNNRH